MTQQQSIELAQYMGRILDEVKHLVPPDADDAEAQASVIDGLLKIAYTYGRVAGMPPEIFMLVAVKAMAEVDKIIDRIHAERRAATASTVTFSDEQAREILARLKEGGRVH